ncbi:MAG: hypothetical protein ACM3NQ_06085 [Bacteroidales bacterium]
MATAARARIEALLRERKLDTTLTSTHPPAPVADDRYVVPTGIAVLDEHLGGGLSRGQMSELVGPRSSARTSVLMSALAGATARGELVALVDTADTFDPPSARACGLDLARLLWVRGGDLDRALKAFNLILQAGGFGLVAIDLADIPPALIKRLPFTTWFRLERPIEGTSTAVVIVASEPVARSAGGVTIALRRVGGMGVARGVVKAGGVGRADGAGGVDGAGGAGAGRWSRLFPGLDVEARIGRARGLADTCRFHLSGPEP